SFGMPIGSKALHFWDDIKIGPLCRLEGHLCNSSRSTSSVRELFVSPNQRIRLNSCALHLVQLTLHQTSLAPINARLSGAHAQQAYAEKDFSQTGRFPIEKWFAGLPIAAGWLLLLMLVCFAVAYIGHEYQSPVLALSAFFLMLSAVLGFFG